MKYIIIIFMLAAVFSSTVNAQKAEQKKPEEAVYKAPDNMIKKIEQKKQRQNGWKSLVPRSTRF